jgi:hypothetical protein
MSNVIRNVEVFWVKMDPENPVKPFDKMQWEVQLRTTDKAIASEWKKKGMPVKQGEHEGNKYFQMNLKKLAVSAAGKTLSPPKCVDGKLKPLDSTTVGNGSIANVQFSPREWSMGGKEGIVFDLMAIQVTKLVEYSGSSMEFDIVDLGGDDDDVEDVNDETPFDLEDDEF